MYNIIKFRKWRKYNDCRIEEYCKKECVYCSVNKNNGQAFCNGKFKQKGKMYFANGLECDKVINFCFDKNTEEIK